MKVHVNINQDNFKVNETFIGVTSDDVVGKVKARIAKELGFALRMAVNAMTNIAFAQEVVRRLNTEKKLDLPIPNNCDEFIKLAQQQGYAQIEA